MSALQRQIYNHLHVSVLFCILCVSVSLFVFDVFFFYPFSLCFFCWEISLSLSLLLPLLSLCKKWILTQLYVFIEIWGCAHQSACCASARRTTKNSKDRPGLSLALTFSFFLSFSFFSWLSLSLCLPALFCYFSCPCAFHCVCSSVPEHYCTTTQALQSSFSLSRSRRRFRKTQIRYRAVCVRRYACMHARIL